MGNIKLFEFQEKCVDALVNKATSLETKGMIVKSPTGSGKTIILSAFVDKLLEISDDTVVLWFCPGTAELEEQSKAKMELNYPHRITKNLNDVLSSGFRAKDSVFINWEQINKKNNKSITESEKANLYDMRDRAVREGLKFLIIIDEEHRNKNSSDDVIVAFNPFYSVRVSATTKKKKGYDFYEINEVDVINSGLITKALYVNEDVNSGSVENEHKYLLELADKKRKEIKAEYEKIGDNVNPLIIVQFPDNSSKLIEQVENILMDMNYLYENNKLSKWFDKDKINIEGISESDAKQEVILIKQAIATGWDCPRAKILVKLRENMSEDFSIQTIGRIRRMPRAKHYDNELLDNCYLYTFDEEFKNSVINSIDSAFETKRVFLKEEYNDITFVSEMRDLDQGEYGANEVYKRLYEYFEKELKITKSISDNKTILESYDFDLSSEVNSYAKKGKTILTEKAGELEETIKINRQVNTSNDGFLLMQAINMLKQVIYCDYDTTNKILKKMFRKSRNGGKILKLDTKEFYAFLINNADNLKHHFRSATAKISKQYQLPLNPKTIKIKIPKEEVIFVDSYKERVALLVKNVYKNYLDNVLVKPIRSKPERMFERYCEKNNDIEWVYKNGDKGAQYLSIVYLKMFKQMLFYPDYIVKYKNGDIGIMETKGGENESGSSENIDEFSKIKFDALKRYAEKYGYKWGFVRNKKDEENDVEKLYINNEEYTEKMGEYWKELCSEENT